jgi:hypothetical protein
VRKDRWTDRKADMIKVTVAYGNFVNVPKSGPRGEKYAAYLLKHKTYRCVNQ